jgi:hypothetical protein
MGEVNPVERHFNTLMRLVLTDFGYSLLCDRKRKLFVINQSALGDLGREAKFSNGQIRLLVNRTVCL